ncbi:MAG: LytR/AlgR family response regulator transcription factor [Bacteroidota bacterium]
MKPNLTSSLPLGIDLNLKERLNTPFPYYMNDDRKNVVLILCISLFVIAFMSAYKPVGHLNEELNLPKISIFSAVTFIVLFVGIIVLPKIFPATFDPMRWTLQKYLIHKVLNCVAIGAVCVEVDVLYICPEKPLGDIIIHAYSQVALIGIIPATFMTLFLKNKMLHENLQQAILINRELEKIRTLKKDLTKPGHSNITIYSDTSETLSLNLPDLLFIEADDNYSTIYWMTNDSLVQKKLLRVNLKNVESQINNPFTIRCHRSFVVNIHAISSITGNTNGYKLRIKETEHYIPVSRPKGKEVMEKIGQLKNMMELY